MAPAGDPAAARERAGVATHGDCGDFARQVQDVCWNNAAGCGAVPELAGAVRAPAPDPVAPERAGVSVTGGDRGDQGHGTEGDDGVEDRRTPGARDLPGTLESLCADGARADRHEGPGQGRPTRRVRGHISSGGEPPAGVILAVDLEADRGLLARRSEGVDGGAERHRRPRGDRSGWPRRPQDDRRADCEVHVHRDATGGCRAIAELPRSVVAPARYPSAAREGTGVIAPARGDRPNAAGEPSDNNRNPAGQPRAVAELAALVAAPAADPTAARDGARVFAAHRNPSCTRFEAEYSDGDQTPGRRVGHCRVRYGAIPELADMVVAPAHHPAAARERARVLHARCDRRHAVRQAHHVDRDAAGGRRAIPELPVFVEAPALHPARGRDRTGVVVAGADRADAAREAEDIDRAAGAAGRAGPVVAPALDAAAARERTGVQPARRDCRHAARQAYDINRNAAVGVLPVPELAATVVSPALHATAAGERASVDLARVDRHHPAREAHDIDRRAAVGGRAIPELTGRVLAPALHPALLGERASVARSHGDRGDRDGGHRFKASDPVAGKFDLSSARGAACRRKEHGCEDDRDSECEGATHHTTSCSDEPGSPATRRSFGGRVAAAGISRRDGATVRPSSTPRKGRSAGCA